MGEGVLGVCDCWRCRSRLQALTTTAHLGPRLWLFTAAVAGAILVLGLAGGARNTHALAGSLVGGVLATAAGTSVELRSRRLLRRPDPAAWTRWERLVVERPRAAAIVTGAPLLFLAFFLWPFGALAAGGWVGAWLGNRGRAQSVAVRCRRFPSVVAAT